MLTKIPSVCDLVLRKSCGFARRSLEHWPAAVRPNSGRPGTGGDRPSGPWGSILGLGWAGGGPARRGRRRPAAVAAATAVPVRWRFSGGKRTRWRAWLGARGGGGEFDLACSRPEPGARRGCHQWRRRSTGRWRGACMHRGSGLQFIGGAWGIDLHLDAQEGAREQVDIAAWQGLPVAASGVGLARRV
jgi:hypothetical protein